MIVRLESAELPELRELLSERDSERVSALRLMAFTPFSKPETEELGDDLGEDLGDVLGDVFGDDLGDAEFAFDAGGEDSDFPVGDGISALAGFGDTLVRVAETDRTDRALDDEDRRLSDGLIGSLDGLESEDCESCAAVRLGLLTGGWSPSTSFRTEPGGVVRNPSIRFSGVSPEP